MLSSARPPPEGPANSSAPIAHVRYYARRQEALCHLPPPTPHPSNKITPFRLFSGDGDARPLRVRGTCFCSSVPFRIRVFAFVIQTSRLFFAWHRPRCIFSSYIFSPASHWLGCFITGRSLFLTGYCQPTLSKFGITIFNVSTTTSTDHHKNRPAPIAHVRYYVRRQEALCHLPSPNSTPPTK